MKTINKTILIVLILGTVFDLALFWYFISLVSK